MIKNISIIAIALMVFSSCSSSKSVAANTVAQPKAEKIKVVSTKEKSGHRAIKSPATIKALDARRKRVVSSEQISGAKK